MVRITGIERANIKKWVEEFIRYSWMDSKGNFVERWENGFCKELYHGRTTAFYQGDSGLDSEWWSLPPLVKGINTIQPPPFNNAIKLTNKNPRTGLADMLYFAPMAIFKTPVRFTWDFYSPTVNNDNFPIGTDYYIGFEINSGGAIGEFIFFRIRREPPAGNAQVLLEASGLINGVKDGQVIDITSVFNNNVAGAWKKLGLVVYPNRVVLLYGDPLVVLAELPHQLDWGSYMIPFFANESNINGTPILVDQDVYVGNFWVQQLDKGKTCRKLINNATIAGGQAVYYDYYAGGVKSLALTVRCTFNASATAGIRVYLLATPDRFQNLDSENVDDAFTYFEPKFAAGQTKQKTVNIDALPKDFRILIRNLDATYSVTNVNLWVHEVFE